MVHEELTFLYDNYFTHSKAVPWSEIPYRDEPFIEAWEEYIGDIPRHGVLPALSRRLVQLCFPVMPGMRTNANYQHATRRGLPTGGMPEATGTKLEKPADLKVYLHPTMAGRIPVLETGNRKDFETLVRVFSHRNEPVEIPASMGGCLIKGYNNWDRVAKYKQKCAGNFNFNEMKSRKELYQDTFLILTDAEYSGVPAQMLGLAGDAWRKLSMVIRREHEGTHYFTLRVLGSAGNRLLDEFIADYMGIVAAAGRYRADWFLCFMGLENYPVFRPGGRLANYLKNVELSPGAWTELKSYIKQAAENVEEFANTYQDAYSARGRYEMLLRLAGTNLIELATVEAKKLLSS